MTVTLVWQSTMPTAEGNKVFVHLVNGDGAIVAQSDAEPAGGYSTDRWVEGEVVTDTHVLALPPDLPSGDYHLRVGLYDPITGRRLPAAGFCWPVVPRRRGSPRPCCLADETVKKEGENR